MAGGSKKPNRGSQPPTERTEAMGGEAQDDHFGGQSEHFEGALWPHWGEKMATTGGGTGHAEGRNSGDGGKSSADGRKTLRGWRRKALKSEKNPLTPQQG